MLWHSSSEQNLTTPRALWRTEPVNSEYSRHVPRGHQCEARPVNYFYSTGCCGFELLTDCSCRLWSSQVYPLPIFYIAERNAPRGCV